MNVGVTDKSTNIEMRNPKQIRNTKRKTPVATHMRLSVAAVIVTLSLATFAADPPAKEVALTTTNLADPNMVLSPGAFDATKKDRPIVCYNAYDVEVLLPNRKFVLNDKQKPEPLHIGKSTVTIEPNGGELFLRFDEVKDSLKPAQLGFKSVDCPLGDMAMYRLAFPRAYSYQGQTTVFVRSGQALFGTVEDQPFMLYDDNLDGKYSAGDGVALFDGGKIAVFAPLGKFLPTPKGVYTIDKLPIDASQISKETMLTPYAGQTGKLKIQSAAKDFELRVAVASEDGQCAVGMLAGSALTVPAGKYKVLYGLMYSPLLRRTVAVITPGSGLAITVAAGQETLVALGESLQTELAAADSALTKTLDTMLEVDLSPVADACEAGDVAKAQKLFTDMTAKYQTGPNYQATKAWFDSLAQRLELEGTTEAAALRAGLEKALAALKQNDTAAAKAQLPDVQKLLATVPAKYANTAAYKVYKARVESLARCTEDRQPGLKVAYYDHNLSKRTGGEIVQKVFWDNSFKGGTQTMQFAGARYEGFLIAPEDGEYELSLESDDGARLSLDGQQIIDHWKGHNLAEKSAKLKLSAGPHALKIEYYQTLGGAALHFRWTPPAGRRSPVPAWALETARE